MENQNSGEQNGSLSDIETDEENEEGDYTVYECPGLAPVNTTTKSLYIRNGERSSTVLFFLSNFQTGEMEVKNPLFDDQTPVIKNAAKQQPHTQQPSKTQQSNDDAKTSHQSTKK